MPNLHGVEHDGWIPPCTTGWSGRLVLAEAEGWTPAGTLPPPDTDGEWPGHYLHGRGQVVTADDAAGIADALTLALERIGVGSEDVNRNEYRARDPRLVDGILRPIEQPWAHFHGRMMRGLLEQCIEFCRLGAFSVWSSHLDPYDLRERTAIGGRFR